MALTYGEKWAIYMLLAQHTGTDGTKSQLRTTVEANFNAPGGATLQKAVAMAARDQMRNTIQDNDIGILQSLDAEDLRSGLGMGATPQFYIPTSGPCPPSGTQAKIIAALTTIQP